MTSKSLFFKRIKQDLHQRVWFPVILFIVAFIAMELSLVSEMDYLRIKVNALAQMREYLVEFFSFGNPFLVVTGIAAVICAISGFSYMHSARKLDTYHSMPVKREQIFWQQYVYGILYYVIPVAIHAVICFGIGTAMGAFSVEALGNMAWFILIQTLFFVLFYSVSVTAVCLTGNMVISVLGCGVLIVYSIVLFYLKSALCESFFDTYFYDEESGIWAFSPIHLIWNMLMEAGSVNTDTFVYADYTIHYVKMLIQAAVYTFAALWLYKKRPTEAAGKSIAFGFVEPLVKTMVALPVTIMCAFIFRSVVSSEACDAWFIFGVIFGLLLSCLVMEAIFRQNPKEVFKHPKQLAVNGVIVAVVLIIFRFDVFGYDYYIPTNVKSYALSINNMNDISMYSEHHRYWCLENMELTPSESVTKLIEQAIEDSEDKHKIYYTEQMSTDDAYYTGMYVKYQLENGKEVYRSYLLNLTNDTTQQLLAEIYTTEEYKLGVYPILSNGWKQEYNTIEVVSAYAEDSFELSEDKMAKLIETYQRELKNLTYEEVWNELPVAELAFRLRTNDNRYDYESDYKIYDSFTQTIALLEEYGCIMETTLPIEQIIKIEVEDWSIENSDTNGEIDKVMRVVYAQEDADKLADIMDNIESTALVNGFNPNICDYSVNVEVTFMLNDKEYERYFDFKTGCLPAWLREELNQSAIEMGIHTDDEIAVAIPTFD